MARKLMGPSFGKMFPVSVLLGAIVVVLADLAGRMLSSRWTCLRAFFTAGVGAPFFNLFAVFQEEFHNRFGAAVR
ncbi:iron chelate uptake ABC transporter family permease subunit [Cohnella faecalis]|uniref:Uncharacterized protein n=1 Tax=Cohnella faecalis TaxID=2315694 RepID=A0A398CHU2_9BACL|nr:iron chelate uptake ABC transporter family permease subunit [Cohnella faecalis]RIE00699.1 hypothetical protein D3H35_26225 [Cohnella faecalis]